MSLSPPTPLVTTAQSYRYDLGRGSALPKVTQLIRMRLSFKWGLSEFSEKGYSRKLIEIPVSPIPWSCLADVRGYHGFPTSEVRGVLTALKALGACPPRPGTSRNPIPHVFCLRGCICLNTVPSVISRACNGSGRLVAVRLFGPRPSA